MSEVKHTPGPWRYDRHADFSETDSAVTAENGHIVICQIWGLDVEAINDPQSEANGRLLAAAPDMLAALNGWIAIFKRDGAYLSPLVMTALKETLAAIEKATAQQPQPPVPSV